MTADPDAWINPYEDDGIEQLVEHGARTFALDGCGVRAAVPQRERKAAYMPHM